MANTWTAAYADIRMNDNARFRTQMDFISTSIQSAGWTQTADTGQIDFATVAAPGAASTFMGYEIFYSGNTNGPRLYMKLEYGSAFNSSAKGFRVNFGTGSDGAGALKGGSAPTGGVFSEPSVPGLLVQQATGLAIFSATAAGGNAGDDYICGTAERLCVACCDDANQTFNTAWGLTRMHDASGTDTSNGWIFWNWSYNVVGKTVVMPFSSGSVPLYSLVDSPPPQLYIVRHVGDATHIPVKPIYWLGNDITREGIFMPLRDVIVMPTALAADRTQHSVSHVGATRNFITVYGNVTAATVWGVASPAAQSLAMRYD